MTEQKKPGLFGVLKSVMSGFFGVQSTENRERDFRHGKASHFIIAGLIFTAVFILVIWGVVTMVLNLAGAN